MYGAYAESIAQPPLAVALGGTVPTAPLEQPPSSAQHKRR
jgi:hypothetical protein